MKHFNITITGHCPCPRSRDYRVSGSDYGTVLNRAVKMFRKDIGRRKILKVNAVAERVYSDK